MKIERVIHLTKDDVKGAIDIYIKDKYEDYDTSKFEFRWDIKQSGDHDKGTYNQEVIGVRVNSID